MNEKFKELRHIWEEDKEQWLVVEIKEGLQYLSSIVFNLETCVEIQFSSINLQKEFIQHLIKNGISVVVRTSDEHYGIDHCD